MTWGRDPDTGGRLSVGDRWPERIQMHFGSQVRVLADGLPGRTAGASDPRLPYPTAAPPQLQLSLLINGPVELLIIMLGTNDLQGHLFRGIQATADAILDLVISTKRFSPARNWSPEVLLLSPPVLNIGAAQTLKQSFEGSQGKAEALSDALCNDCSKLGVPFFDVQKLGIIAGSDGIHLPAKNSRALGDAIADTLASRSILS